MFQELTFFQDLTLSQAQELSRLPRDEQGIVFDRISSGKLNSYEKL